MEQETNEYDGLVMIYSNNAVKLKPVLKKLKSDNIQVCIQSSSSCILDLNKCILDTINEYSPDFIIIDNDEENKGLDLYEMIKAEGTIDSIPTIILDIEDEDLRLKALELGALDIVNDALSQETYKKIKNYTEIGKKISSGSNYDRLTSTYKRKYAESITKKNIEIAKEEKTSLILMVVDIHDVGSINKKLGKKKGDQVLINCSDFFKKEIGMKDYIFRYSGERFVLVFQDKTIEHVLEVANKIQSNVNSLTQVFGMNISLNAGISVLNAETSDFYHLINDAIKSLSLAEEVGGSKIYIHDNINTTKKDKHILIIDQDTVLTNILAHRYKNKGYKVSTAKDVEHISQLFKNETINLLIIDFEPFTTLQKHFKNSIINLNNTKIIVLSSSKSESVLERALKNGADQFIQKPLSIVELDLNIQRII